VSFPGGKASGSCNLIHSPLSSKDIKNTLGPYILWCSCTAVILALDVQIRQNTLFQAPLLIIQTSTQLPRSTEYNTRFSNTFQKVSGSSKYSRNEFKLTRNKKSTVRFWDMSPNTMRKLFTPNSSQRKMSVCYIGERLNWHLKNLSKIPKTLNTSVVTFCI